MLLEVQDIHSYYGDSHVLQGVSLEIDRGELIALLGRQGAGKTTTLWSITGVLSPRRGKIVFDGESINDKPSHVIARNGIAIVPEGRHIFPRLTTRENLMLAYRPPSADVTLNYDFERVLQEFPELEDLLSRNGNQLSGGQQQILAVARALMSNPRLLLLDEPTEGLAPLIVERVAQVIRDIAKQGMTILVTGQNLSFLLDLATRVYIIENGASVYTSDISELHQQPELLERYLAVGR